MSSDQIIFLLQIKDPHPDTTALKNVLALCDVRDPDIRFSTYYDNYIQSQKPLLEVRFMCERKEAKQLQTSIASQGSFGRVNYYTHEEIE